MLDSAIRPLQRGDIVASAGRTAVVWKAWPEVLRVFPIVAGQLPRHRSDVDWGPADWSCPTDTVVRCGHWLNIRRAAQLRIGAATDAALRAISAAYQRELETQRHEERWDMGRKLRHGSFARPCDPALMPDVSRGGVVLAVRAAAPLPWHSAPAGSAPVPGTLRRSA